MRASLTPLYFKQQSKLRFFLTALLLCSATLVWGQSWTVQTIPTRILADGKSASVAFAMPTSATGLIAAPPVRHVLVYPQPGGAPQLKVASGRTDLSLGGPWVRAAAQLKAQGVAVVYVDPPSAAGSRGLGTRSSREVARDHAAVAKQMQLAFPGAQIHLAGFGQVAPLLDIGGDMDGFSKILVASSF